MIECKSPWMNRPSLSNSSVIIHKMRSFLIRRRAVKYTTTTHFDWNQQIEFVSW